MKIPEDLDPIPISRVIPIMKETLEYCAVQALLTGETGALSYNAERDEVCYHYKPNEFDVSIFDLLLGVEEIWIITKGTSES